MANDLSKAQARVTQQDRITRNRSALFRDAETRAPQRRYMADVRNAARGDGGAQELREILGLAQDAAGDFQKMTNARFEQSEADAGARALLDSAAGTVDVELERKSLAYRRAISLGRAQRGWSEGMVGFDAEMEELLASQSSADPAERKAEVIGKLDEYFRRFAVDEETGQLKDFGSAAANRWLAEKMSELRQNVGVAAAARIDEKMERESINDVTATVEAQLSAGQDVDWATVFDPLLPTVDRKVAVAEVLTSVKNTAMALEETDPVRALRIIDGVLGFTGRKPAGASLEERFDAAFADVGAPPAQPAAAPKAAAYVSPFSGFSADNTSSRMGAARSGGSRHNGEDFPVPVGTPIVAPMGGKVVGSWRNARGGHQVRVELDDGTIVGFAHLSSREVKEGQRVEAGQLIAKSGNTGKSTGPHIHMTAEREGKKVSPTEVFSAAPLATSAPAAGPPLNPGVLDPETPSEQADALGPTQITAPTGALQLSAAERSDLLEFRRKFRNAANSAAEQRRNEEQGAKAGEFLSRLSGLGAYPTTGELQEAARRGEINPSQLNTLLNVVQADADRADTLARRAESEVEGLETESKESRVERVLGSVLGPVYRGAKTVSQARAALLEQAAAEPDIEVRRAILSGAEELNKVQSLRTGSPEYRRAVSTFDEWQSAYVGALSDRRLPRGMTREQAAAIIRGRLDVFAAELGGGEVPPDRVEKWMDRVEPRLDAWFDRQFPRRTPAQ